MIIHGITYKEYIHIIQVFFLIFALIRVIRGPSSSLSVLCPSVFSVRDLIQPALPPAPATHRRCPCKKGPYLVPPLLAEALIAVQEQNAVL